MADVDRMRSIVTDSQRRSTLIAASIFQNTNQYQTNR